MHKRITSYLGISAALFAVPLVASAQELGNIEALVQSFGNIIDMLIPIAFTLILLAFFWGLARYVMNADDEEARDQGKRIMIGGIIALFVASAIWGIIGFLENALLGGESEKTEESPGTSIERDFDSIA